MISYQSYSKTLRYKLLVAYRLSTFHRSLCAHMCAYSNLRIKFQGWFTFYAVSFGEVFKATLVTLGQVFILHILICLFIGKRIVSFGTLLLVKLLLISHMPQKQFMHTYNVAWNELRFIGFIVLSHVMFELIDKENATILSGVSKNIFMW